MPGFDRYHRLLTLFTLENSSWTAGTIAETLNAPVSSVYRSLRELVATGLLESAAGAHFRLGPTFLEFERSIRLTDPLIQSGTPLLHQIARSLPMPLTAVLARLYGDRVMCVADARSSDFRLRTSYEYGRPMPIIRGATSRAILAQLPGRTLSRLLDTAGLDRREADRLRQQLARIRQDGLCITRGQVDPGLIGYAVPIANKTLGIHASLSCIFSVDDHTAGHDANVFAELRRCAAIIIEQMNRVSTHLRDEFADTSQRSVPT